MGICYGFIFSCIATCLRLFEFMLRCRLISFVIIRSDNGLEEFKTLYKNSIYQQ